MPGAQCWRVSMARALKTGSGISAMVDLRSTVWFQLPLAKGAPSQPTRRILSGVMMILMPES